VRLDARAAVEIRRYLDRIPAATPETPSAEERELHRIATALGPDVLRRWEDGDGSIDLAAEVRGLVGFAQSVSEALNSGDGSYRQ
jgi:hypothetical protein